MLEKLGFGPDEMLKLNPRLIYARMYGYEKDSKYADMAGHDIGYSSLSGVLSVSDETIILEKCYKTVRVLTKGSASSCR